MPVRAKRIQYFDDRLFAAVHGAQRGELPFPVMGGGEARASGSGTGASGGAKSQPKKGAAIAPSDKAIVDGKEGVAASSPKPSTKIAPVIQAAVAQERRQMEMDFAGQSVKPVRELNDAETEQYAGAVDELAELETNLVSGETH